MKRPLRVSIQLPEEGRSKGRMKKGRKMVEGGREGGNSHSEMNTQGMFDCLEEEGTEGRQGEDGGKEQGREVTHAGQVDIKLPPSRSKMLIQ